MLKHSLVVFTPDKEDGGWVGAAFSIPLPGPVDTYRDTFALVKDKLATPEIIELLRSEDMDSEPDFLDDCTGEVVDVKFHSVHYRNYGIEYDFELPDGDMVTLHKDLDDIVSYE